MQYNLQGKDGKDIYAKRKCTVKPAFGIIKNATVRRYIKSLYFIVSAITQTIPHKAQILVQRIP